MGEILNFGVGRLRCALGVAAWIVLIGLSSSPAQAAKGWAFKEVFGSATQPSFGTDRNMAVDNSSGDLLVIDDPINTLSRWHPDGTASDFSGLGTNVIDGKKGPEGKPCAEEPASCDETPGNVGITSDFRDQVAIDNSGGPGEGRIYITNRSANAVDVFAPEGQWLQRITTSGSGPLVLPGGVAVDSSGNVYVGDNPGGTTNDRVHKFSPSLAFVSSCPAISPFNLAVGGGPTAGTLFASGTGGGVEKLDLATCSLGFTFDSTNVRMSADPLTGHLFTNGANAGKGFVEYDVSGASKSELEAIEVEDVGGVIHGLAVAEGAELLYVAREGTENVDVWEAVTAPEVEAGPPSFLSGAKATVTGSVEPEGQEIVDCFFEYGKTTAYGGQAPCEPEAAEIPADFGSHEVGGQLSALLANGTTYHYRLVVKTTGTFVSEDETLVTADTYSTDTATAVSGSSATLNGTVKPEGVALTECRFEYGNAFLSSAVPCSPAAGAIPNDDSDHPVSATLTGLEPGNYRFRLVAQNALGQIVGDELTFTIAGPPRIVSQVPAEVGTTTATLHAKINPAGAGTTYHFEWGADTSYGNRRPAEVDAFIGSGTAPVTVSAQLKGLQEDAVYHFRVIASNAFGTTTGPDQAFSTLNSDGLAWGRRYELVSPADKGPVGEVQSGGGPVRQTSVDGGAIAYEIEYGLKDATAGYTVQYRSDRGTDAWLTTQLNPSWEGSGPVIKAGTGGSPDAPAWLSRDLECGFRVSSLPLTGDTAGQPVVDAGGTNIYRRNPGGSFNLVTNLVPTNLEEVNLSISGYAVADAAEDCSRVIFTAPFRYPGVPFSGGLYEWREGTLGNPAAIPGPSGPVFPPQAGPGAGQLGGNRADWNALSDDGSRFYFTAKSALGGDLAKSALFLNEDGEPPVDVSQSQTATANNDDSRYQMATPDGSRVFFIARYGLATNASSSGATSCAAPTPTGGNDGNDLGVGCDLYRYSAATGELLDLTPASGAANPQGASVAGVLDTSEDGSRVYFAAKGQLVPDEGQTFAQNNTAATRGYNVYLWEEGAALSYVATVLQDDVTDADQLLVALAGNGNNWASQSTPSGGHLIFQSAANLTSYDSGGELEAYRYSAASGELQCVSCRRDGQPALAGPPLSAGRIGPISTRTRGARAMSADGASVFFAKPDPLTPGALAGLTNLYEWRNGQISLLVTQEHNGKEPAFAGAAADGSSVFFQTQRALVPWEIDERGDLYVARVDGGFPPPPEPPEPCDALGDECAGDSTDSDTPEAPASAVLASPGNVTAGPRLCPKGKLRRGGKCLSKRQIARRRCRKVKGGRKAKRRCMKKQVRRLTRATADYRRAGK